MSDVMTTHKAAWKLFEQGYNCAQAVFSHAAEELGLDEEEALKIASGFGGGMLLGEMCGCVTGAIMALGLKYGFSEPNDSIGKGIANEKTMEFLRKFKEKNGAHRCKDLLGMDVSIPEEKMKISQEGLIEKKCPGFVSSACEILDELLDD
jgi:C_GCAxxG_C_C family probable redox protein